MRRLLFLAVLSSLGEYYLFQALPDFSFKCYIGDDRGNPVIEECPYGKCYAMWTSNIQFVETDFKFRFQEGCVTEEHEKLLEAGGRLVSDNVDSGAKLYTMRTPDILKSLQTEESQFQNALPTQYTEALEDWVDRLYVICQGQTLCNNYKMDEDGHRLAARIPQPGMKLHNPLDEAILEEPDFDIVEDIADATTAPRVIPTTVQPEPRTTQTTAVVAEVVHIIDEEPRTTQTTAVVAEVVHIIDEEPRTTQTSDVVAPTNIVHIIDEPPVITRPAHTTAVVKRSEPDTTKWADAHTEAAEVIPIVDVTDKPAVVIPCNPGTTTTTRRPCPYVAHEPLNTETEPKPRPYIQEVIPTISTSYEHEKMVAVSGGSPPLLMFAALIAVLAFLLILVSGLWAIWYCKSRARNNMPDKSSGKDVYFSQPRGSESANDLSGSGGDISHIVPTYSDEERMDEQHRSGV